MSTVHKPDANPIVAALLTLVLFLGHFLINGQQRKWLFNILAYVIGLALCCIPGFVVIVFSVMEAYQTAERLQRGETIGINEYTNPTFFKIMRKLDKEATGPAV